MRQLATASADKTVKLWNLDGFILDRTLSGLLFPSFSCYFALNRDALQTMLKCSRSSKSSWYFMISWIAFFVLCRLVALLLVVNTKISA